MPKITNWSKSQSTPPAAKYDWTHDSNKSNLTIAGPTPDGTYVANYFYDKKDGSVGRMKVAEKKTLEKTRRHAVAWMERNPNPRGT